MEKVKNTIIHNHGNTPLVVSHRGVCRANIPCNSIAAFQLALQQGAEVIELDVAISKDGELFVFHPGTEGIYLKNGKALSELTAAEIKELRLLNQDEVPTSYTIPTLEEAFQFLKGKAYINVDKYWTDVKKITAMIRKCGVEKQVIVKSPINEKVLKEIEEYAPDLMFMAIVYRNDDITDKLKNMNLNFIGNEVIFVNDEDYVISNEYITKMHNQGFIVWANSIIYNEKDIIGGMRTDDVSLLKGPDLGWGYLADKKVDLIQTDWPLEVNLYFAKKYGKKFTFGLK